MTAATVDDAHAPRARMERMLDGIERVGNKVPHPAMLFVYLIVGVIVLSQILFFLNVKATYEVVAPPPRAVQESYYGGGSTKPNEVAPTQQEPAKDYKVKKETTKVAGLLTGDGVRFIFTSFVTNFQGFSALTLILVVMIGVGLAEEAGLIAALVRKLVAVSPPSTLAFIIVLIGVISSIASDAGYLVLIPLGAAAYLSVGRNPLAGMAAGFAGVSAGFGVNVLITPTDTVLTEITNEAIHLVDPHKSVALTANLYFGIASTILVAVVGALITTRIVERQLGKYDPKEAGEVVADAGDAERIAPEAEARGLRWALYGLIGVVIVIALLTVFPGAPLRNPETGSVIGDSPFMDSLVFMITVSFFVCGFAFGRGAGTIKGSTAVINAVTKHWATLAGLLLLFPADRHVPRLLQLQPHSGRVGGKAGRSGRAREHRRRVAADPVHRRHRDHRPDSHWRDRAVGHLCADLHFAVPPVERLAGNARLSFPTLTTMPRPPAPGTEWRSLMPRCSRAILPTRLPVT
jgi:aminobenzoyl-glutamate transport protein